MCGHLETGCANFVYEPSSGACVLLPLTPLAELEKDDNEFVIVGLGVPLAIRARFAGVTAALGRAVLPYGVLTLGILAALCCHICARKSKLGRHCDNYCVPAKPGDEDCAVGAFADPA